MKEQNHSTKNRPLRPVRGGGVHVKTMQARGHTTYNLLRFKLSMLVLKYFSAPAMLRLTGRLVDGQ